MLASISREVRYIVHYLRMLIMLVLISREVGYASLSFREVDFVGFII